MIQALRNLLSAKKVISMPSSIRSDGRSLSRGTLKKEGPNAFVAEVGVSERGRAELCVDFPACPNG